MSEAQSDSTVLLSPFEIADKIIEQVYPDFFSKGKGWWGSTAIPNYGLLRSAIEKAIRVDREKR